MCVLELLEDRTLPAPVLLAIVDRPGDMGFGTTTGTTAANTTIEGDLRYVINQTSTQVYSGSTILSTSAKPAPSSPSAAGRAS